MKGVKGTSFGVRFYRRAGARIAAKEVVHADVANAVESFDALERAMQRDETREARMTILPPHNHHLVLPRENARSVNATGPEKTARAAKQAAAEQALWIAAQRGDCARIRVLVMEGVDLDARDEEGRTAFNIATQYAQHAALKTLLAAREMRRLAAHGELPGTPFFDRFRDKGTGR